MDSAVGTEGDIDRVDCMSVCVPSFRTKPQNHFILFYTHKFIVAEEK